MSLSLSSAVEWLSRRIPRVVATVAAAGLLVSGLSAGVARTSTEAVAAAAAPTTLKTAAATTVALPRAARATATIAEWSIAGPEKVAEVWPEVGKVKSGQVALSIDAPVVPSARTAASVEVPVEPDTTYAFEAYVRVMSKTLKTVPASIRVGATAFALPKLDANWKLVSGTYTAGATETAATLSIRLSKAVRGLSIDAVKLYATGDESKTNIVPNGSFEDVKASRGIVSTSLVMTTPTAALAVALPAGTTTWEVFRGSKLVKKSTTTMKGTIMAIPLSGVSQGYYTLKVRASDKKSISTKIAVVDSPNPWITQDKRYGVALHVENASYKNAARDTRALGIAEARNDVFWQFIEKKKGTYDYSVYDAPFARLKAQGIGILGIAGYGNAVYGKQNARAPISSTAITAFGKYSAAIAKRFDFVGLEVYNEFNHKPKNWSSCRTAGCYSKILKSASSAVGKVKPKMPIIAGATARYDAKWFDALWKAGAIKNADAVSFHPYEITGSPEGVADIVKKSRTSMKKYGKTTKPIWITELGTSSYTGNRTQTEQASVLLRSSVTAFANSVRKYYWYDLINDYPDPKMPEGNFGLYSHPGKSVAAVAPKIAGFTQALTITQLGNRNYRGAQKLGTGVVSQAFGPTKDSVSVVWSPKGTKTATFKTTKPVVLVRFDGTKATLKPKKGVVKFAVTKNPVFLRVGSATAGVTR